MVSHVSPIWIVHQEHAHNVLWASGVVFLLVGAAKKMQNVVMSNVTMANASVGVKVGSHIYYYIRYIL